MQSSRWTRALTLTIPVILATTPALASGPGISIPGCTSVGDSILVDTTKVFHRYRVPSNISLKSRRDLEFFWSDRYSLIGKPLVPPGQSENDLDRLGKSIADISGSNPLGHPMTDIQLVYDYLNFRGLAYSAAEIDSVGFEARLNPTYDALNRNHADTYVYFPGGPPNGDGPSLGNRGTTPADFKVAGEDVSSGRDSSIAAVLDSNSVSIAGPFGSQVGLLDSTRWTRPSGLANAVFNHEFQHMINIGHPTKTFTEVFSSIAEALVGEDAETPRFDVPYTWSLTATNYAAWRSFTSYLTYNFRGADTTFAGRTDDLVWRWARRGGLQPKFTHLALQLDDSACVQCPTVPGFAGLGGKDRLQLLIHSWRVANFVNSETLSAGYYGFPARYGFEPARHTGAWQNVDLSQPDSINIPPELVLGSSLITRPTTFIGRTPNTSSHVMSLRPFGSEYWVLRSDATLSNPGNDLEVVVSPEGITRSFYPGGPFFPCSSDGGRLMLSVISYEGPAESLAVGVPLWRMGQYAKRASAPIWVDTDSLAGSVSAVVESFGSAVKAAVVVVTLEDGERGAYTGMNFIGDPYSLPYRLRLAVRRAPQGTWTTKLVARAGGILDDRAAWSPTGDSLAYQSVRDGFSQIFRCRVSDTTAIHLIPTAQNQYAPDWSPRGDFIAYEQDSGTVKGDIWRYSLASSQALRLTWLPGFATRPAFSPNGTKVAYLRFPGLGLEPELRVVNADGTSDGRVASLSLGSAILEGPRWSPTGSDIYFSSGDSLYAVPSAGGPIVSRWSEFPNARTFDIHGGTGQVVAEEPGRASACGASDHEFRRIAFRDQASSDTEARFYVRGARFGCPRWSRDGTQVAFSSDQNAPGDRDLYIGQVSWNHPPKFVNAPRDTVLVSECSSHPYTRTFTALDPDGEAMAYQGAYLPPGATLSASGVFTWPYPAAYPGDYYVVFRVLDGSGGLDQRVVKITAQPDAIRPAPTIDLVAATGKNSAFINWTMVGDDSLSGNACMVDARYSTQPITEANFTAAPGIATYPPGPPESIQCAEVTGGLSACTWYYFALKTQDDAGYWSGMSSVASAKTRCGGSMQVNCDGSPLMAQSSGSGGWSVENSVLGNAVPDSLTRDRHHLRRDSHANHPARVRLSRRSGNGLSLDAVGLSCVDHAASQSLFLSPSGILSGSLASVAEVRDGSGANITAALSAGNDVVTAPEGSTWEITLGENLSGDQALHLEAAGGNTIGPMTFERESSPGAWQHLATLTPRWGFEAQVVEIPGATRTRVTFASETQVRRVSRVAIAARPTTQPLTLSSAIHSNLGSVAAAVATEGEGEALLTPGQHMVLDYEQTELAAGQLRDYFLDLRGRRVNLGGGTALRETRTEGRGESFDAARAPLAFALHQAEPTPFTRSTRIRFDLPKAAWVHLEVFDLQGRRVAALADEFLPPGSHARAWNGTAAAGTRAPHGVYVYRIRAGDHADQKKLVLMP